MCSLLGKTLIWWLCLNTKIWKLKMVKNKWIIRYIKHWNLTINCNFTLLKIVYAVVAQLSLKRHFCALRNTCSVFVEFNKEENNSNISALIHAHKETLTITLNRLYSWPCFRQQVISKQNVDTSCCSSSANKFSQ